MCEYSPNLSNHAKKHLHMIGCAKWSGIYFSNDWIIEVNIHIMFEWWFPKASENQPQYIIRVPQTFQITDKKNSRVRVNDEHAGLESNMDNQSTVCLAPSKTNIYIFGKDWWVDSPVGSVHFFGDNSCEIHDSPNPM